MPGTQLSQVDSLEKVEPTAWDALVGEDHPLVGHAFLLALERSGSVGTQGSGWHPRHLLLHEGTKLLGAVPLYEKHHSYGEYIFDWPWAEAAAQAGISYYPKLVSAVPFTPATGPRLLQHPAAPDRAALLWHGAQEIVRACGAHSLHVLFCEAQVLPPLVDGGALGRSSLQFHWRRQPGWHGEADYLAALRSSSRKQMRRERQAAQGHGLRIAMRTGKELGELEWAALERFYRSTVDEKGGLAYLTPAFFVEVRRSLLGQVLAALAYDGDAPVAGALFFRGGRHLYGRYWGAERHYDALHFELCYHQPIAWALQHGISRFEAGAQGLHKLKRGLLPQRCHSAHWLRHPGLGQGVARWIAAETLQVDQQIAALAAQGPFGRAAGP